MKYLSLLCLVAACMVTYFSQASLAQDATPSVAAVQKPQEPGPPPDPDELITYRFRLGTPDSGYSLVAVNKTDQPGQFLYRGLTAGSESRPQDSQATHIEAGQSLTVPAATVRWPDFDYIYVEASRRVDLRLVPSGSSDFVAIPLTRRARLYDVMSEERLQDPDSGDFEETVTLLGANPGEAVPLKAHEDLRLAAARIAEKLPTDHSKIFLVILQKPSTAASVEGTRKSEAHQ